MKSWKLEAIILAIGMLVMGYFIKQGLDTFSGKDRVVNVKGLAEMEVPANKVTWPLMYKDLGNDLPTLYNKINATNQAIVGFLKQKGITENEISINAPEIIDMQAERYNNNSVPFRYNVTSVITVTSTKVDLVRKMISEQSELLKQGIAITGGDYRYNVQYDYTGLNDIKPQMIVQKYYSNYSNWSFQPKNSDQPKLYMHPHYTIWYPIFFFTKHTPFFFLTNSCSQLFLFLISHPHKRPKSRTKQTKMNATIF